MQMVHLWTKQYRNTGWGWKGGNNKINDRGIKAGRNINKKASVAKAPTGESGNLRALLTQGASELRKHSDYQVPLAFIYKNKDHGISHLMGLLRSTEFLI